MPTERLVLRMFREDDLDEYAAMTGDAEVTRHLGDGSTREDWLAARRGE